MFQSLPALPPLPERIPLRAGPLTLCYEAGDLRYVKWRGREVLRRVYAAVRDRNWSTVAGELREEQCESGTDSFHISYLSVHRRGEIHFEWRGDILGKSDGTISFDFEGEARTTFLRNRIGLCVLHPARECAGARCRAERSGGSFRELTFPELIEAAQPVPGASDLIGLAHEIIPDVWAELKFSGDLFEMEDQRNWLDESYKTFCTPLRFPFPVEVEAGDRVRQRILFKVVDHRTKAEDVEPSDAPLSVGDQHAAITISIARSTAHQSVPTLGVCLASHGQPLDPVEIKRLSLLRLRHLRVDLKLGNGAWLETLGLAREQAHALGIGLEPAIHLPSEVDEAELTTLTRRLSDRRVGIVRVLLFREGEKTLSAESYRLARQHLAALGVPLGAGTDADFHQVNQFRPPHTEADFIHWSINPQVHATDLASIAETPAAIPAQLQIARAFFPDKPLVISPVTLKPRFNPVATGPELALSQAELPASVDPRQLTPFAAAWTLAALRHLAESGVQSVTLFETTGWRGVMEREAGSDLPDKFPSRPGQVYPLYYVLGEISGFIGSEVLVTRSSDPLQVESLALARERWACAWLANLTPLRIEARIHGPTRITRLRQTDWSTSEAWMLAPETLLHNPGRPILQPAVARGIRVTLEPFGFARLEFEL